MLVLFELMRKIKAILTQLCSYMYSDFDSAIQPKSLKDFG